jgi:hypothetical protein
MFIWSGDLVNWCSSVLLIILCLDFGLLMFHFVLVLHISMLTLITVADSYSCCSYSPCQLSLSKQYTHIYCDNTTGCTPWRFYTDHSSKPTSRIDCHVLIFLSCIICFFVGLRSCICCSENFAPRPLVILFKYNGPLCYDLITSVFLFINCMPIGPYFYSTTVCIISAPSYSQNDLKLPHFCAGEVLVSQRLYWEEYCILYVWFITYH